MKKIKVTFLPANQTQVVDTGSTVLEAARLAGIALTSPCGGTKQCGKCRVNLIDQCQNKETVLACQEVLTGDITVEVHTEQSFTILREGKGAKPIFEPTALRKLDTASSGAKLLGLAVDLGTTTIVCYLYDLISGDRLGVADTPNGQLSFGADLITRLTFAAQGPEHYRQLRQAVLISLEEIFSRCLKTAGVSHREIGQLVVVGNTPMMHFLLDMPVNSLAEYPFQPYNKGPFHLSAKELGFDSLPNAICYFPPFIGGFVGSDALAAAISQNLGGTEESTLLVDIGTNGEILLQSGELILAASTPAGPALEGGNITCGMPAGPGALYQIKLEYDVSAEAISGGTATGICGSGLVDAVAEMLRLGLLDQTGHIRERSELPPVTSFKLKQRLVRDGKLNKFMLTENLFVDQQDIRAVQLAKASVAAGIQVLLKKTGITAPPQKILLAGGFGNYLNPVNAQRIGLLGIFSNAPIRQVGNAAGLGAIMLLLSDSVKQKAELLSKRIIHFELADNVDYQELFIKNINFPTKEII